MVRIWPVIYENETQTKVVVCAGTTNPRVTWKPDNPIKGIRNPISRKLDNPLKRIRNLLLNGIRSQWLIWFSVPTYIYIKPYNKPLIATCQ